MELKKKELQITVHKMNKELQVTLDKDMNVPDILPDVEKMIQNKGEIRIEEIEILTSRIRLKGSLLYKGLYIADQVGSLLSSLSHTFEIEEFVSLEGVHASDNVRVVGELEDLNIILINSRKIGIRALITFHIQVNEQKKISGAIGVEGDLVQSCSQKVHLTEQMIQKRDTKRINGEMNIASSKPNVRKLLWESEQLRGVDVRILEGKVGIRGEILIFILYLGEEEHMPVQYLEWEFQFSTEVECQEAEEDMIGNIGVSIGSGQIEIKPDEDGEDRILSLEIMLDLDMKAYKEEQMELLQDIYSPEKNIILTKTPFAIENLIVKNNAKTRILRKIVLKENQGKILQIMHVEGNIKIDEMEKTQEGILLEGVVIADLMYVTGDDKNPVNSFVQLLPFSQMVEVKGLKEKDNFDIRAGLEQIGAVMMDGEEIEMKAVISLEVTAFSVCEHEAITDMQIEDMDESILEGIPVIAGYLVKEGDTLWTIAKEYCTTVESIKEINGLKEDEIIPGTRILLVRKSHMML